MSALRTDLYQLTMAAGYVRHGIHQKVVSFELFVRSMPPRRRFLLFVGLSRILTYLEGLRFTDDDIAYLKSVPALKPAWSAAFERALRTFRWRCEVWAMPEGTPFFAGEPVLRITGPLFQAQLVETFLLSVVNSETLIASKAIRIREACGPDARLLEFGTRRTSPEEAVHSARAAYVAGFDATSNLEAGRRFGLPVAGTAAHAWTMAHRSEPEAFRAYVDAYGASSVLLVDTYDTLEGVRNAIAAAGPRLRGVRLDSGDLLELSKKTRQLLDAAGATGALIVGSGDLNEDEIARLRRAGAPIDAWGVGTELVRSTDAPHLGGVYKMVYDHGLDRPVLKTSSDKDTQPGVHQVHRRLEAGTAVGDRISLSDEEAEGEALLRPMMRAGELVAELPDLEAIRHEAQRRIDQLPASLRALEAGPSGYPVEVSEAVLRLRERAPS